MMPAPEGNKNAVGNNGGRKKQFDLVEEARELIKWADQEDALILRYFAPMRGFSVKSMYQWAEEHVEFGEAFEYARDKIGCRREMIYLNAKSESPFKRYAPIYDEALHQFERGEKKFDAEIEKDIQKQDTEKLEKKMDDVLNQVREARENKL